MTADKIVDESVPGVGTKPESDETAELDAGVEPTRAAELDAEVEPTRAAELDAEVEPTRAAGEAAGVESDRAAGEVAGVEPVRAAGEAAGVETDDVAELQAGGTAETGEVAGLRSGDAAEVDTGEMAGLGAEFAGGDAAVLVAGGAAFAHAPTGRRAGVDDLPLAGDYPDEPEIGDAEDDLDEEPVAGFDRRADMWWLITPLVTLFVAPLLAVVVGFFVAATDDHSPGVCEATLASNGCEEAVLRMIAQHTVAFGVLWLGLWAMPWYRGLRGYRIALAVLAFAVLLAVPFRLISF